MERNPTFEELEQRIKELEKETAELKQSENEIYHMKDFVQSIIKDSPVFLFALDPDGKIILMNETMLNFLGYTLKEVKGKDYLSSFVSDAEREMVSNIFKKLTDSKGPTLNSNRIIARDGRELLLEWHGRQVFKENGELDYFWCLGIGITVRRRTEEELAASEETLNTIIRTIPDIIYRLDTDGYITFISDSIKKYGYEPKELNGTRMLEIVHPEDKEKATHAINERRFGERSTRSFEARLLTKLKNKVHYKLFSISAEGLYTSKKPDSNTFIGTQGIAKDITEQKQVENERVYREKLQSILEMAGAVCHEMNQPIQVISGHLELLLMNMPENEPMFEKINLLKENVNRLAAITNKLQKITRYETKEYVLGNKIIDINKSSIEKH